MINIRAWLHTVIINVYVVVQIFLWFENFHTSWIFNFALSQIHYHNLRERKQKSIWFENFQTKGKI